MAPPSLGGRWQALSYESEALKGNPLGDPHVRPVYLWTPEGDGPFPTIYVLQGFTGTAAAWFNVRPWERTFPEEVDALAPRANVVLVDAFTALGGSQFLDSPVTGNYHTYLCDEIVPWIETRVRGNGARGLQGKSSGGYGAMVTAMLRPDLFHGFATHAGDALFEISYRRGFVEAARALRESYDGVYERFLEDFRSRRGLTKTSDHVLIEMWAMAAAYSAGELPFDLSTGEVLPDVWADWLMWDPVEMARRDRFAAALRGMRGIWIDAGRSDEFFLDLAAEAFRRSVADAGVRDERVHFELHEGGHFATAWRYPLALGWLAERLS
jgi:S-formylglutathione hydrolase FrmB